jgi:hypothetical protein
MMRVSQAAATGGARGGSLTADDSIVDSNAVPRDEAEKLIQSAMP